MIPRKPKSEITFYFHDRDLASISDKGDTIYLSIYLFIYSRNAEFSSFMFYRELDRLGCCGGGRDIRYHTETGVRLYGDRCLVLYGR